MASRIIYGMSRDGALPSSFAIVSPRTNTPIRATLFTGIVVMLFALALPLVTLAEITSFIIILVFTLVNASYFRLRKRSDVDTGLAITPLVAIALCVFLLVVQSYVRLLG